MLHGLVSLHTPQLEMIWNPKPYANVLSNPVLIGLYEKNAASLGVEMDNSKQGIPVGSTDMGNVSQLIPSIHPFFAIGTKAANHTREFTQAAGECCVYLLTLDYLAPRHH